MNRTTVTAADLPDGTPSPSCANCGRTPQAQLLWGINATGATTGDLGDVDTWCCSECFTLAAGEARRRRGDDETAHYRGLA